MRKVYEYPRNSGTSHPYDNEESQYINFAFKDNKYRFWYSPEYKGLVLLERKKKVIFKGNDYSELHNFSSIVRYFPGYARGIYG